MSATTMLIGFVGFAVAYVAGVRIEQWRERRRTQAMLERASRDYQA